MHLETLLSLSFVWRNNLSVIFISRVYRNKITKKNVLSLGSRDDASRAADAAVASAILVVGGHIEEVRALRAGIKVGRDQG